jgi:hypothetical protein
MHKSCLLSAVGDLKGSLVPVQINILKKVTLYLGIWRPPTSLGGGCEKGIVAEETFPGDCEHRLRKFQLDIIHHGFETHNQAILAEGASKKTEIGVRY